MTDTLSNDTRYEDFIKEVREFGRDSAAGKDSLPKLAQAVVRAVSDGCVELGKDKDGNDAAARIFAEYAKSEGKKAIHNRSPESLKANVSKLRQLVVFGSNPKWDTVEVMNDAFTIRQDHIENDISVKPAYAAYVDVARAQLAQDAQLTKDQISVTVMGQTKTKEVTLEGQLKKAAKILEEVITGENKHGIKDQSPEVLQAAEQLNARLAALMTTKAQSEAIEKALAAGFVLAEDGSLRQAA